MRLLLDVRDLDALLHDKQTIIQLRRASDNFQQRRFTGAVTADQTHALGGFQREFRFIEQRDVAKRELRVREGDDCHKYLRM